MVGPRFEQRDLNLQPRPYAAIDLIAQEPVRYLSSHSAVCDGGKGAQGHPKIYINLDKPGTHACLYCGLRFANEANRADIEAGKLE
jgi:NADH dehydrogenase (ubiquinone) Fe-S protein 6